jgi:DNA-binding MarR family transcriptional regulator
MSAESRGNRGVRKTDLALEARGLLIRAGLRLSRDATRKLEVRGLSQAQLELLRRVQAVPDGTQQDLVDQLGVTRGNVSQLLTKLEAEGLVARSAVGTRKVLRITRRGERLLESVMPAETVLLGSRFEALSKSELETFVGLLGKLEL